MPDSKVLPVVRKLLKEHGPQSISELASKTDFCYNSVMYVLRRLKKEEKAHIIRWLSPEGKGAPTAIWSKGRGRNAPRPEPMTARERDQKYRDKNKVVLPKYPASPFEGLLNG